MDEDHDRGVGDDVARAGVLVIAVVFVHKVKAGAPVVRAALPEGNDIPRHAPVAAVRGNDGQARLDHLAHLARRERRGHARRHELPAIDALAIVRHAGRLARKARRALRIARIAQAPAVDEDLAADLLGDGAPVLLDGARARRLDARAQVQVRRVLGGHAVAAPPVEAVLIGRIVEPRAPDLRGGQRLGAGVVLSARWKNSGPLVSSSAANSS